MIVLLLSMALAINLKDKAKVIVSSNSRFEWNGHCLKWTEHRAWLGCAEQYFSISIKLYLKCLSFLYFAKKCPWDPVLQELVVKLKISLVQGIHKGIIIVNKDYQTIWPTFLQEISVFQLKIVDMSVKTICAKEPLMEIHALSVMNVSWTHSAEKGYASLTL